MPVGIQWPVLNKCTKKFHQLEPVVVSLTRVSSVDQWTTFVMVAYFMCWHNSDYVPIWTHLNVSVNCELVLKQTYNKSF